MVADLFLAALDELPPASQWLVAASLGRAGRCEPVLLELWLAELEGGEASRYSEAATLLARVASEQPELGDALLAALQPDSGRAVNPLVRGLVRVGRSQEAVATLLSLVGRSDEPTETGVASWLERLGQEREQVGTRYRAMLAGRAGDHLTTTRWQLGHYILSWLAHTEPLAGSSEGVCGALPPLRPR